MTPPETRYAKSGDVSIAYQVVGNGPLDLIFVPGFVSNLDRMWENLVAGSGLRFEDRGRHALRGLPEEVHLYTVLGG